MIIDITNLTTGVIDLQGIDQVTVTGNYDGPRIQLKNAGGTTLTYKARIQSSHNEDAIVLADPEVRNFRMIGTPGNVIAGGGITAWGLLHNVSFIGLRIGFAHTGIRATQNHPHSLVRVYDCEIFSIHREAVYIGPHYLDDNNRGRGIYIHGNRFHHIGYDVIQPGNNDYVEVYDNVIEDACLLEEKYHDYYYTFNGGSVVFWWNNHHPDRQKEFQSLGGRLFPHKPQ